MDRLLRADITATVREVVREVLEGSEEVWLTAEQTCQQFGMLSMEWLHRYGELLPRERAEVTMPDGTRKVSRWAYPRNRIQREIREGRLGELVKKAREIKPR